MTSVHDNEIISYEVSLKNRTIIMNTFDYQTESLTKVVFSDVFAHMFETELENSIILDIEKSEISNFVIDHRDVLDKYKNSTWPMDYNTIEELSEKLVTENYNYYEILSSFGLSGWVVARNYELIKA
ncbi:hypothetical protein [Paenibacillus sp. PDC88]|uniref:hypothetical protein n=1 Tax=Paenibacillus sp. PDC88 TaxID=1884375 RepID=UPI00089CEDC9|nr:hypothetical protein [Paenibacillus sp. PDC88]SDX18480.1 hypothetical protein SAMN05518848_10590 [Paenibacillus sp. PDC88]